jgi:hypothetical protein
MKRKGKPAAGSKGGPKPIQVVVRSQKQAEASRRNGARSTGPKTAEGKARSALNSFKHGVYGSVLSPHADFRGEDQVFRSLIERLVDDYAPQELCDTYAIQNIAYSIVVQGRIRRAIELRLMPRRPRPLSAEQLQNATDRTEREEARSLARRCYQSVQGGKLPGFTRAEAETFSKRCERVVREAHKAKREADKPERTRVPTQEEIDAMEAKWQEERIARDNAPLFDARKDMGKIHERLKNPQRTLDSFQVEDDSPIPEEDEVWDDDDLIPCLTVYEAIAPVHDEFESAATMQNSLESGNGIGPEHQSAWLEIVRGVYYSARAIRYSSGDPPELETNEQLVDGTLRELQVNLDGFTRLHRLDAILERRIAKAFAQLRRRRFERES